MFDPRSRYRDTRDVTFTRPDGTEVTFRLWRILPRPEDLRASGRVVSAPHERLDNVAARVFGDPTQFWQLCDANATLDPHQVLDEAEHTLVVTEPAFKTTR